MNKTLHKVINIIGVILYMISYFVILISTIIYVFHIAWVENPMYWTALIIYPLALLIILSISMPRFKVMQWIDSVISGENSETKLDVFLNKYFI